MANGYKNTVPLGQVGTGAAYVLGPNMALQQWMGNVQQEQGMRLQAEQRNADINRKNFDSFNQRMAGMQTQSKMYRDDLNELLAGIVNEGAQMMSQGENPFSPDYNNPESIQRSQNFLREVSAYEAAKSTVEQYESARNTAMKNWEDKPDDFDYDSFLKISEFEKNNSIADIIEGRAQLPSLQKNFDMSGFVSKNVGVPSTTVEQYQRGEDGVDRKVTVKEPDIVRLRDNIVNSFKGGQGANYLTRQLRDADIDGDASGIIGTTDVEEIRQRLDEEFRTPAEGNPVGQLIASGQIPSLNSPEYEQFLNDAVTEQLRAEQVAARVFNQAAQVALGAADTSYAVTPTFDLEREARARRSENRAAQASHRAQVQFNERNQDPSQPGPMARSVPFTYGDGQETQLTEFSNVDIAPKSMVGTRAINRETGMPQEIESTDQYRTAGIGLAPINPLTGGLADANDPNAQQKPIALVTRNYQVGGNTFTEEYLVDLDMVPFNLTKRDEAYVNDLRRKVSGGISRPANIKASEQTLNLFK